ncbi:MAG: glutamate 5-kinase [SAR324 cluster bacterium]|nr:glutamate 5-kinase [SAR324 cluster bacterium]
MRIVIKVGTGVLTLADGKLDYNFIQDLTYQIAKLQESHQVLLVSSGAVGAGRAVLSADGGTGFVNKKSMLASAGQSRLMQIYTDFFWHHKIIIAQALLKRADFENREVCLGIRGTFTNLLKEKILPIINENDVINIGNPSFGDNDHLAALTSVIMEADRMIILTDVDGLYTADPRQDANAKLIKKVVDVDEDVYKLCKPGTLTKHGLGGMLSKVKAANLAVSHGVKVVITRGKNSNSVLSSVDMDVDVDNLEQLKATMFIPKTGKRPKLLKSWMKNLAKRQGTLKIDYGATQALKLNRSLLAVGVNSVSGSFKVGDVLLIENESDPLAVGVGRAEISSQDMLKVLSRDMEGKKGQVFIHRRNLFLY